LKTRYVNAFALGALSKKVIGSLMYQTYIDFKIQELEEHYDHVSEREIQRYLNLARVHSLLLAAKKSNCNPSLRIGSKTVSIPRLLTAGFLIFIFF
jgi:hypothetical protein